MTDTKLSVNINKIATLRNARGGNDPNVTLAAEHIESFGAQGITVHPRPDERHIKFSDVYDLKSVVKTELNVEGYPSDSFLKLIKCIVPAQVTLVPDPPDALTSNAGWNISTQKDLLRKAFKNISASRISVFVDPATCKEDHLKLLRDLGAHRIELYTEAYAKAYNYPDRLKPILDAYAMLARLALKSGLGVNAGHDLNQQNLKLFITEVPEVSEVSIGHALISEALYTGLEQTVKSYLKILTKT